MVGLFNREVFMYLKEYLRFLFLGAPIVLAELGRRGLVLSNYETSLGLNLRLILIPLFGDKTRVGRLIGFVFRLLYILFGIWILLLVLLLATLAPVFWYIAHAIILYKFLLVSPIVYILLFVIWYSSIRNKPFKAGLPRPLTNFYTAKISANPGPGFKEFLESTACQKLLIRLELDQTDFSQKLVSLYSSEDIAKNLKLWEQTAENFRVDFGNLFVEPEHFFLATLEKLPSLDKFLYKYALTFSICKEAARWLTGSRDEKEKEHFWQKYYVLPPMGGVGKGMTGRVTPSLDSVSTDYTGQVKKGYIPKTYWRKEQIDRVADLLGGSNRNVLVIGPPGCGKTGVIIGIAHSVIKGTKYKHLRFKRIINLEVGKLLAGTRSSGDVAEKLKKAMEDVVDSGDIIVFIDDIHTLIAGTSSEDVQSSVSYTVLQNYLASQQIQFIGATNIENYRKYIEPNGSFSGLFQVIDIPPSTKEETLEILKVKAENLEREFKVNVTYTALNKIVELGDKLIHERVFPDKAIDILNRSVAVVAKNRGLVNIKVVLDVLSDVSKIPVSAVSQDESQKLLNIENEMKKRVIGQDEAISMVSSSLLRARAGIRNENKPIASFLFIGTTGVGKTETAKALTRCYFGDEKMMVRLDMSEYQQKDSISRLLGAPDGSSKGVLTEAVRTRPFTLILLDEIEKAHPDILLTFLQVLDDGRLTDSSGMTVSFTNTMIIATSNIGTRSIQGVFAQQGAFDQMKEAALKDVKEAFAPEFLNRFTGIVVFKPLTPESVKKIAEIMLNSVKKMAEAKGIKVTFQPDLIDELVKRGYNPQWGARPLARVIEDSVESYLAVKILKGDLGGGDELQLGREVFDSSNANANGGGGIQ